jgi:hypothetical protein
MILVIGALSLCVVLMVEADEPMFVRWLVVDDPGDATIRDYWERAERNELKAPELVDLGTMLFARGYPKDAVRNYEKALDLDPDLYEAWFRIGLVEHSQGNLREARDAYKKCLKRLTGHGWCNFYLGLLEEQIGHTTEALDYYRRAFKFAPELSDPKVNPEMLTSDLAFAAKLREYDRVTFSEAMPMRFLQPKKVERVKRRVGAELAPEGPAQKKKKRDKAEAISPTSDATTQGEAAEEGAEPVEGSPGESPPPAQPSSSGTSGAASPKPPSSTRSSASPRPSSTQSSGATAVPTPRSENQPFGMPPPVSKTSPEAHLLLEIPGLWELAALLV